MNTILFSDDHHQALIVIRNISKEIIFVNRMWLYSRSVKIKKIINWFRDFSLLINEGVQIEDALSNLVQNYKYTTNILNMTRAGIKFNKALNYNKYFFDDTSINIVNSLIDFVPIELIIDFICKYNENVIKNKDKVLKSIFLPIFTLFVSLVTIVSLIYLIKEPIKEALSGINVDIPYILIVCDNIDLNQIMWIFIIIFLCLYLFIRNIKKMPIINKYYLNKDILISFKSLSFLLENGIHLLTAMSIVISTVETERLRRILKTVMEDLLSGQSLYQSMSNIIFNSTYKNIIRTYEITGNLGEGFLKCSKIAESYVDNYLNYITRIIGPLFTLLTVVNVLCFLNFIVFPLYNILLNFNL